jgi:hypothetical protein
MENTIDTKRLKDGRSPLPPKKSEMKPRPAIVRKLNESSIAVDHFDLLLLTAPIYHSLVLSID